MKRLLDQLNTSCDGKVEFIQVGSNEGVLSNDPLCNYILNYDWKGVLIEPVPRIFKKLKENYKDRPHLNFEMVAVSDAKKTCDFFVIDDESEFFKSNPSLIDSAGQLWGDQLGSFSLQHILDERKFGSKAQKLSQLTRNEIKSLSVDCVTINDIASKYDLYNFDLLHIDAEGHDDVILSGIDYSKVKPKMIIFEHMHMSFERYCLCLLNLKKNGYELVDISGIDSIVAQESLGFEKLNLI